VQGAGDVRAEWLEGVGTVGVTAGASAPESIVQEVVARLRALGGPASSVESQPLVDEGVVFQLPRLDAGEPRRA
jgi:4-hydroxy-3-methylbut-2-enyl diphosphate reductase